jgi:hypothetical protein
MTTEITKNLSVDEKSDICPESEDIGEEICEIQSEPPKNIALKNEPERISDKEIASEASVIKQDENLEQEAIRDDMKTVCKSVRDESENICKQEANLISPMDVEELNEPVKEKTPPAEHNLSVTKIKEMSEETSDDKNNLEPEIQKNIIESIEASTSKNEIININQPSEPILLTSNESTIISSELKHDENQEALSGELQKSHEICEEQKLEIDHKRITEICSVDRKESHCTEAQLIINIEEQSKKEVETINEVQDISIVSKSEEIDRQESEVKDNREISEEVSKQEITVEFNNQENEKDASQKIENNQETKEITENEENLKNDKQPNELIILSSNELIASSNQESAEVINNQGAENEDISTEFDNHENTEQPHCHTETEEIGKQDSIENFVDQQLCKLSEDVEDQVCTENRGNVIEHNDHIALSNNEKGVSSELPNEETLVQSDHQKEEIEIDNQEKVDHEETSEQSGFQTEGKKIDNQDNKEKFDDEKRSNQSNHQIEANEIDIQENTEEVIQEKSSKQSDLHAKGINNQGNTENVDHKETSEQSDLQTEVEEIDNQKNAEKVEHEETSEQSNLHVDAKEIDNKENMERVDHEEASEQSNNQAEVEKINDVENTENFNHEETSKQSSLQAEAKEINNKENMEKVDHEQLSEQSDLQTEAKEIDNKKNMEKVDHEEISEHSNLQAEVEKIDDQEDKEKDAHEQLLEQSDLKAEAEKINDQDNTENVNHEKTSEQSNLQAEVEKIDDQEDKEKDDHEQLSEQVDHQAEVEKIDEKEDKEKVDHEQLSEQVDLQAEVKKIDDQEDKEKDDHDQLSEQADFQAEVEKINDQENTEKVDHEQLSEQADPQVELEKINDQEYTEKVDHEQLSEQPDLQAKLEKIDNKENTENFDHEDTSKQSGLQTEAEKIDNQENTEKVYYEETSKQSNLQVEAEKIDNQENTEKVEHEKTSDLKKKAKEINNIKIIDKFDHQEKTIELDYQENTEKVCHDKIAQQSNYPGKTEKINKKEGEDEKETYNKEPNSSKSSKYHSILKKRILLSDHKITKVHDSKEEISSNESLDQKSHFQEIVENKINPIKTSVQELTQDHFREQELKTVKPIEITSSFEKRNEIFSIENANIMEKEQPVTSQQKIFEGVTSSLLISERQLESNMNKTCIENALDLNINEIRKTEAKSKEALDKRESLGIKSSSVHTVTLPTNAIEYSNSAIDLSIVHKSSNSKDVKEALPEPSIYEKSNLSKIQTLVEESTRYERVSDKTKNVENLNLKKPINEKLDLKVQPMISEKLYLKTSSTKEIPVENPILTNENEKTAGQAEPLCKESDFDKLTSKIETKIKTTAPKEVSDTNCRLSLRSSSRQISKPVENKSTEEQTELVKVTEAQKELTTSAVSGESTSHKSVGNRKRKLSRRKSLSESDSDGGHFGTDLISQENTLEDEDEEEEEEAVLRKKPRIRGKVAVVRKKAATRQSNKLDDTALKEKAELKEEAKEEDNEETDTKTLQNFKFDYDENEDVVANVAAIKTLICKDPVPTAEKSSDDDSITKKNIGRSRKSKRGRAKQETVQESSSDEEDSKSSNVPDSKRTKTLESPEKPTRKKRETGVKGIIFN